MFKRKTLTAMLIIAILACTAAFFGVKGAAFVRAEEAPTAQLTYEDEAHTKVTGFTVAEGVTEFEIVIPDGVKEIGEYAFNASGLTAVTLNEGLETIGNFAFAGTAITSINIPKSVKTIGQHAFEACASLTNVAFAQPDEKLEISGYAFKDCGALRVVNLPDNTTVRQFAFERCMNLQWVYVGANSQFKNSAGEVPNVSFFPTNTSLSIVFPTKSDYNGALNQTDKTFKNQHEAAATYIVKVNCYIGASETPVVYERLHNKNFNYVSNKVTGGWNEDTAFETLPVQDVTYSATTWYNKNFEKAVSYGDVNELLKTESEINIYCHATIAIPTFPDENASWVYKKDTSYDINNISEVLKALGCTNIDQLSEEQLKAIDFTVTFSDEKGNPADKPDAINTNGMYTVNLSLKSEYGSWAQETVTSTVTINVNTNGFTTVMIVLLVVGILAVLVTVSTAVIRKKVQERNKKKQLSQKEILEKFKANGGETTLS